MNSPETMTFASPGPSDSSAKPDQTVAPFHSKEERGLFYTRLQAKARVLVA